MQPTWRGLFALAVAGWLSACGGSTEPAKIEKTRVAAKVSARFGVRLGATSQQRFASFEELRAMEAERERAAQADRGPVFLYDLPAGWRALPAAEHREINLCVDEHPEAQCWVTALGGDGGGPLLNVNRWRSQMVGLGPIDEAALAELEQRKLFGVDVPYVELDGDYLGMSGEVQVEDARMMAVFLVAPMATISVKMVGPREVLIEEAEHFRAFCESLRFNQQGAEPSANSTPASNPGPAVAGGPESGGGLRWRNPDGWQSLGPSGMRIASFRIGSASELSVIRAGGELLDNINRWRSQVGAPAISSADVEALERAALLGSEAVVVEAAGTYVGMGEVNQPGWALYGAIGVDNGVFVKMVGPAGEVASERERFSEFLASLEEDA